MIKNADCEPTYLIFEFVPIIGEWHTIRIKAEWCIKSAPAAASVSRKAYTGHGSFTQPTSCAGARETQ